MKEYSDFRLKYGFDSLEKDNSIEKKLCVKNKGYEKCN